VLDRERVLGKLNELNSYMRELRQITPTSFKEYQNNIEKKRSGERLLQLCIECVLIFPDNLFRV